MPYNPRRRHRTSTRLSNYDYTQAGMYFVTICVRNRICLFGSVVDEILQLNGYGAAAQQCWIDIPTHFPCTELDAFVVMPNHIHGIVVITDDPTNDARRDTACRVSPTEERFGQPVVGSLPTIVRSYKSAVTKHINTIRNTPGMSVWQSNYYERIIRNETGLHRVREYIAANPAHWIANH